MEKHTHNSNSSRIWIGLIILVMGLVFFLDNIGVNIPGWIISWHTLLILIGLLIGYKRNFVGGGWLIMVLIGGIFTVGDILSLDMSKYYFAMIFIALGLFMIFKPKRGPIDRERWRRRFEQRWNRRHPRFKDFHSTADINIAETKGFAFNDTQDNDILDSVNVCGGSHQNIYSKNFKGGDVIAIFGGSDINLTQADFEGTITLDVVAIFGGMKIVIPPGWEVKSEVTAIFGGIDDKRAVGPVNNNEPRKVLIIKGVALFGGVDIRNF